MAAYAAAGWTVWPIHPDADLVADCPVIPRLEACPGRPVIVTVYMRAIHWQPLLPTIAACQPDWLWLNPGTESAEAQQAAAEHGLRCITACNLVALRLGDPRDQAERWWREQHNS